MDRPPRGQHRERGGWGNGRTTRAHGRAVFHDDASLYQRAGLTESINDVSSESHDFPGRYLRHFDNPLHVQPAGTALDRQHAASYAT